MAAPTTNANLLEGVGEFPPVTEHEILSLLGEDDANKTLAGDALLNWHNAAYERVKNDFNLEGFSVDTSSVSLSTAETTMLQAACCFRIMADLYFRNSNGDKESNSWSWYEIHDSNYDRIRTRWQVISADGSSGPIGQTIPWDRA
jgi:hypothetical protein